MIYLGADHGGFKLKETIKKWLGEWGLKFEDLGAHKLDEEDDYPQFAFSVAERVIQETRAVAGWEKQAKGILICRSAAGVIIAANKVPGIRAVAVFDVTSAKHSREHNDANVLGISGDWTDEKMTKAIIKTWLDTKFSGEKRHLRRINQIRDKEFQHGCMCGGSGGVWRKLLIMVDIIPGINERSFEEIQKQVRLVADYVEWLHFDIADNTLTPMATNSNWPGLHSIQNGLKYEAHLMVSDPKKYIEPLVANGFTRLIAHVEADNVRDFITEARLHHIEVGVALDGPSELELVEPYLDQVDCVLVMMYKAGASGQIFQPQQMAKIQKIHSEYKDLPIEVDGGITKETAIEVRDCGATRLVSTSYLFWKNKERIEEAIAELRGEL